jgi:peptidoglycan/LPS O-acetylase OafA/YrhL
MSSRFRYVKEFEGLRGLMAIWVLIGHWAISIPVSFGLPDAKFYNGYAVDVFVMLSGFAIFSLLESRHEPYGPYLLRRFFRIFPVYLFYLGISVLLQSEMRDAFTGGPAAFMDDRRLAILDNTAAHWWQHLVAHLTLLHGLIPETLLPDTNFAFLGQAWSLSLEWQFYLIAPLLLALVGGRARLWLSSALIAAVIVSLAIRPAMGSGFLGAKLHLFVLGIATFYAMRHIVTNALPVSAWRGRLILGALICFLLLLRSPAALPFLIWVITAYAAMATIQGGTGWTGLLSRLLNSWPIQWLGHISYSVYLSHMIAMTGGLLLLERIPGLHPWPFAIGLLAIVLPGTIVLSLGSFMLIERPFMNLGSFLAGYRSRRMARIDQQSASAELHLQPNR